MQVIAFFDCICDSRNNCFLQREVDYYPAISEKERLQGPETSRLIECRKLLDATYTTTSLKCLRVAYWPFFQAWRELVVPNVLEITLAIRTWR